MFKNPNQQPIAHINHIFAVIVYIIQDLERDSVLVALGSFFPHSDITMLVTHPRLNLPESLEKCWT